MANAGENDLDFLPYIYDIIKSTERDSRDVPQKIADFRNQLLKARECIENMPGVQYSRKDQLKQIEILQQQLATKTQLIQKYKSMEVKMSEEEDIHPIFNKDPEEWMQYVYKKVSVVTEDGMEHTGLVYTVDPVSESFVLVNIVNDQTKVELVMGHAVTSVTVLSDQTEINKSLLDSLFRPESLCKLTAEELKQKLSLVKSWLLKNRLPVETGGSEEEIITVAGALIIQPPYEPENCISTNEIILGKIQGLIKTCPKIMKNGEVLRSFSNLLDVLITQCMSRDILSSERKKPSSL